MTNFDKLRAAKRLNELQQLAEASITSTQATSTKENFILDIERESTELYTEITVELMSEEELKALVSFNESDIGSAISKSRARIRNEYRRRYIDRINATTPDQGVLPKIGFSE